jgi:hypothetical protein
MLVLKAKMKIREGLAALVIGAWQVSTWNWEKTKEEDGLSVYYSNLSSSLLALFTSSHRSTSRYFLRGNTRLRVCPSPYESSSSPLLSPSAGYRLLLFLLSFMPPWSSAGPELQATASLRATLRPTKSSPTSTAFSYSLQHALGLPPPPEQLLLPPSAATGCLPSLLVHPRVRAGTLVLALPFSAAAGPSSAGFRPPQRPLPLIPCSLYEGRRRRTSGWE